MKEVSLTQGKFAITDTRGTAMKGLILATIAVIWGCTVSSSPSEPPSGKSKLAEEDRYEGTLKYPVYAIGGETTGTMLKTEKGDFELDLNGNKEMKEAVQSLKNKRVVATGKLTTRKGEEVPERHIILVSSLSSTESKQ